MPGVVVYLCAVSIQGELGGRGGASHGPCVPFALTLPGLVTPGKVVNKQTNIVNGDVRYVSVLLFGLHVLLAN